MVFVVWSHEVKNIFATDNLIGVHCTHGLNRTGYMVCRYMRDRLTMPAAVAIRRKSLFTHLTLKELKQREQLQLLRFMMMMMVIDALNSIH